MITWFAFYRISDSTLVSVASSEGTQATDAQLLAAGVAKIVIPGPPTSDQVWDKPTKTFIIPVAVAPVLSADETLRQTLIAAGALTLGQQAQALQLVLKKLGAM